MKIIRYSAMAILACLSLTISAHAQGGCLNSPENPTVVLALVGSAAVFVKNIWRRY